MEGISRLKIKIGQHEFEAEGPANVVQEQFEAFKSLVASAPPEARQVQSPSPDLGGSAKIAQAGSPSDMSLDVGDLSKIMKIEGRTVSLTIRPRSIEEAVLLIIYGQKVLQSKDLTTGGEIMAGLESTGGLTVGRVDRLLEKLGRDGDVIVSGARRSKRYRLTNAGLAKVRDIASEVLAIVI